MDLEQDKDSLPRPVSSSRCGALRSRRARPLRRAAALFIIGLIVFCNLQPLVRVLPKPPQSLQRLTPETWRSTSSSGSSSSSSSSKQHLPAQAAVSPAAATSQKGSDETAKKLVPLEAHIMSKCPDAQDCLVDLVVPAMQRVSDKVDFQLSFIGDVDNDDTVHCKHGEDECLGNVMMLCAQKLYPDPKISLGFSTCLIRDYEEIPSRRLAEGCALEHAVDFGKLNDCMSEEGEGLDMLKASVQRSAAAKVQFSCTVRLDDKFRCIRDDGQWVNCDDGSEPGDLIRDINSLYKEL